MSRELIFGRTFWHARQSSGLKQRDTLKADRGASGARSRCFPCRSDWLGRGLGGLALLRESGFGQQPMFHLAASRAAFRFPDGLGTARNLLVTRERNLGSGRARGG